MRPPRPPPPISSAWAGSRTRTATCCRSSSSSEVWSGAWRGELERGQQGPAAGHGPAQRDEQDQAQDIETAADADDEADGGVGIRQPDEEAYERARREP